MATPRQQTGSRETRIRKLEAELARLAPDQPRLRRERELLARELRLVKMDRTPATPRVAAKTGGSRPNSKVGSGSKSSGSAIGGSTGSAKAGAARKRPSATGAGTRTGLGKGIGKGITTEALGGLGKALTPKNLEESLSSIVSLRSFCKQCMRYVQQADTLLDTLFVTTNSLKESGVLSKLAESKGKNLNTSDFTNILMALMNSPMGSNIFKRLGSSDNSDSNAGGDATTSQAALPAPVAAPGPAQSARGSGPGAQPSAQPPARAPGVAPPLQVRPPGPPPGNYPPM